MIALKKLLAKVSNQLSIAHSCLVFYAFISVQLSSLLFDYWLDVIANMLLVSIYSSSSTTLMMKILTYMLITLASVGLVLIVIDYIIVQLPDDDDEKTKTTSKALIQRIVRLMEECKWELILVCTGLASVVNLLMLVVKYVYSSVAFAGEDVIAIAERNLTRAPPSYRETSRVETYYRSICVGFEFTLALAALGFVVLSCFRKSGA